jgi:hypothetical protein
MLIIYHSISLFASLNLFILLSRNGRYHQHYKPAASSTILHAHNQTIISFQSKLEEKFDKRLETWKGNCLSMAGRITLIDACLTNSPIYHMSMYLLPKTTIKKLDAKRRRFLWQGGGGKKSITW